MRLGRTSGTVALASALSITPLGCAARERRLESRIEELLTESGACPE